MAEPDWTAQLDQTLAATRDFATAAATFFRELLEQEVPAEAAVALTNGYVGAIVIAAANGGEEG
jgi:hypothetical protein